MIELMIREGKGAMRRAGLGLLLVFAAISIGAPAVRSGADEHALMLRPQHPSSLDRIQSGREDVANGTLVAAPITDLLIELRPAVEQPRRTAMIAPGDTPRQFIDARLFLVTRGRIDATGRASCGQFDGDILVCQVACEGGAFGLRHLGNAGRHDLVVGMQAQQSTQIRGLGFRVGACSVSGHPGTLVLPATGRLAVSIPLIEATD